MNGYKTHLYLMRCLTNLHAGSGEANYGVIDKLVQRDCVSGYPEIHSSGIKGAIREYFSTGVNLTAGINKEDFFYSVFGSEKKSNPNKMKPGDFKFFNASLLSIPVRSNFKPFYRATSPLILNELKEKCKLTGIEIDFSGDIDSILKSIELPVIFEVENNVMLEDFKSHAVNAQSIATIQNSLNHLKVLIGDNIALCNDPEHMRQFTKKLPVIARNCLENGISENLWYEEIIPRETRFYTVISFPANEESTKYFTEFDLQLDKKIVQVGANASIGYGFCEFTKISK